MYTIRKAMASDISSLAAVEAECFPSAEAADEAAISARVSVYPDYFRLLFDGNRLIGFVDGFVTDLPDLSDEMYEKAEMHNPAGAWQMIFGLNVIPAYRRQGCAAQLMNEMIRTAREEGRRGLVLTCKDRLVHYYASFGFKNEGVSGSVHGGVVWYQMRLSF